MNTDPKLNVVPFVSVDHMMKLVLKVGIDRFLTELAATIEEDFRRWPVFDKTPRVASHSEEGVIELMPTSDGTLYGFKYVNGHPKNTRDGRQIVTAFGVPVDPDVYMRNARSSGCLAMRVVSPAAVSASMLHTYATVRRGTIRYRARLARASISGRKRSTQSSSTMTAAASQSSKMRAARPGGADGSAGT